MAEKNIKCAPQHKADFESICGSSKCKIKSQETSRFGVTTFVVYYKTVKELKDFQSKLKS